MQLQRMDFIPILCITIDTILKFDEKAEANVNIDAQCERTLRIEIREPSLTCVTHDTSGGNVK